MRPHWEEWIGKGGGDLQTDRVHDGEVCSEHLIQLSSWLAPEDKGGKGAEHETSAIQPANGWEAV